MGLTAFLLIAMSLTVVSSVPLNRDPSVEYEWPNACRGKSYCHVRPNYYPEDAIKKLMENVAISYRFGTTQDRFAEDVGSCEPRHANKVIYLIKDKNDEIRFVPQTAKFNISIGVEECKYPGKIRGFPEYLTRTAIETMEVDCVPTMVQFIFPVLSFDGKSLESEAPKDGISLACSAKVLANKNAL